jgi:hypothetical protein
MVMNKSQYHERKEVEIMYRCYELICNDIRTNAELAGIAKEPSLRTLISWAMQAKAFDNPVKATRYSILPSLMIPDELKEHVNRILTTIIIPRFPPKYKI